MNHAESGDLPKEAEPGASAAWRVGLGPTPDGFHKNFLEPLSGGFEPAAGRMDKWLSRECSVPPSGPNGYQDSSAERPFRTDDEAAAFWLQRLRDGAPAEQAEARTEIGLILERRGKLDDASAAYYENVRARVRDPRPYERLAAISRRRGDNSYAAQILGLMRDTVEPPTASGSGRPRGAAVRNRRPATMPLVLGIPITLALIGALVMMAMSTATSAGCADPTRRFPEWRDPEGAVQRAVSQNLSIKGINPYRADPFVKNIMTAYNMPPEATVAGWIAYSLYWTHKGYGANIMPLAAYVERQFELRIALGSLLQPGYLGAALTREEWAEMQSWSASTCPGSLLRAPENTKLVRLMSQSMGDTAWQYRQSR